MCVACCWCCPIVLQQLCGRRSLWWVGGVVCFCVHLDRLQVTEGPFLSNPRTRRKICDHRSAAPRPRWAGSGVSLRCVLVAVVCRLSKGCRCSYACSCKLWKLQQYTTTYRTVLVCTSCRNTGSSPTANCNPIKKILGNAVGQTRQSRVVWFVVCFVETWRLCCAEELHHCSLFTVDGREKPWPWPWELR